MTSRKETIRCRACAHWDEKAQYCRKNETAAGPDFSFEKCGGVGKGSEEERAAKIRGHMEDMIRIANRHGYCIEKRVSDSRLTMRNEAGEQLEIELLEMS